MQHGALAAARTPHSARAVLIMASHAAAVARNTIAGAEGIKITPADCQTGGSRQRMRPAKAESAILGTVKPYNVVLHRAEVSARISAARALAQRLAQEKAAAAAAAREAASSVNLPE